MTAKKDRIKFMKCNDVNTKCFYLLLLGKFHEERGNGTGIFYYSAKSLFKP